MTLPPQKEKLFPLEGRTARFGEAVINFCKVLAPTHVNRPLISHLIRSATSIGANYAEANAASSKKDFSNRILLCKRESQETKHWLRMIATAQPEQKEKLRELWQECQELTFIFGKITSTLRRSDSTRNSTT